MVYLLGFVTYIYKKGSTVWPLCFLQLSLEQDWLGKRSATQYK